MTVQEYIQKLKNDPSFMKNVTEWRVLPARAGALRNVSGNAGSRAWSTRCVRAGIEKPLHSPEHARLKPRLARRDFVVVTPTAFG